LHFEWLKILKKQKKHLLLHRISKLHTMQYDTLLISNVKELYIFPFEKILFISADGNYSYIHCVNDETITVVAQLGDIHEQIYNRARNYKHLVRIGRSLIINMSYLVGIDLQKGYLALMNDYKIINIKASVESLKKLKAELEQIYG